MKRLLTALVAFALAVGTAPQSVVTFSFSASEASARPGGGGGFSRPQRSRPAGGARTRPAAPRPSAPRPSVQPRPTPSPGVSRPSTGVTRPSQPAVTRPSPGVSRPRPDIEQPVHRPPGARPPGSRPPGARPPGTGRPPGARPPGTRPPGARPPAVRPPVARPPGWRPPHHRPPTWRPPYYPPPYYRPPHYYWGPYYWSDSWGWFFTAVLVTSTLVFVSELPDDKDCEKVESDGETLYLCDGVLYRSTYYEDEQVYEIVSDDPNEETSSEPLTPFGLQVTDPLTRGEIVRDVQQRLVDLGYDVGTVDGVYGSSSEAAVMWLQYDNDMEPTGVVDEKTADLLGYKVPSNEAADSDTETSTDGSTEPSDDAEATESSGD